MAECAASEVGRAFLLSGRVCFVAEFLFAILTGLLAYGNG